MGSEEVEIASDAGEGRKDCPNLSRRRSHLESLELLIQLWPETSFASEVRDVSVGS